MKLDDEKNKELPSKTKPAKNNEGGENGLIQLYDVD